MSAINEYQNNRRITRGTRLSFTNILATTNRIPGLLSLNFSMRMYTPRNVVAPPIQLRRHMYCLVGRCLKVHLSYEVKQSGQGQCVLCMLRYHVLVSNIQLFCRECRALFQTAVCVTVSLNTDLGFITSSTQDASEERIMGR
jgi:hypothetical protein